MKCVQKTVKYQFYLRYFHENYKFSGKFFTKITNLRCETFGKKKLKGYAAEPIVYKRRTKKFYGNIKEIPKLSQKHPEVLGTTFDYMQNLPYPIISKVWLYTFEIHNLKTAFALADQP